MEYPAARKGKEFYIKFFQIAAPVALQSLITTGTSTMDSVMLGVFGEIYLSATSFANEFFHFFKILCMGTGFGASVLIAQYYGHGEKHLICQTITLMLRIIISLAAVFMLFSFVAPAEVMKIYTKDQLVIEAGARYLRILSCTFLIYGVMTTLTIALRSISEARLPLIASFCSFWVNIFFNWVFIFGKLGAPKLEIAGAAVGTFIARSVELSIILWYVLFKDQKISYKVRHFFLPANTILPVYIRYALPVLCVDTITAISGTCITMINGRIGTYYAAAAAITALMYQLTDIFEMSISGASGVLVGQTIGSGDRDLAFSESRLSLRISAIIGGVCALICALGAPTFISAFNIQAETQEISKQLIWSLCTIIPFRFFTTTLGKGVLRGGGDTKFLLVTDELLRWIVAIPLGYAAAFFWRLPPYWVYLFLSCDRILKILLFLTRFYSKKWIHML